MAGLKEPQNQMEVEIKQILDQLKKDCEIVNAKNKDFTGLDGPGARECRKLTKKAFARITEIKKEYGNE